MLIKKIDGAGVLGENIRIIQMNDLHISSEDIFRNGANIRNNFLKALNKIKKIPHDFIVLNGDLAHDIDDNDYQWLKKQMDGLEYHITSGNHDLSPVLAKAFGLEKHLISNKLFYKRQYKGKHFVFADTSEEYLDTDILKRFIDRHSGKSDTFVFMHHPPSLCNAKHMDTFYPLGNHAEAEEYFNKCDQVEHVFCAHYHTNLNLDKENFALHICPSTWYQIGRNQKKFNIRNSFPGFGIIDIGNSVKVKHYYIK